MIDVKISKLNDTWMKVTCKEVFMELDIQDRFSFEVPNAQYDPRVKFGKWDGIKKLFNRQTKKMYIGLLMELLELCSSKNWTYQIDPLLMPSDDQLTREDLIALIDEVIKPHDNGVPLVLYDYQEDALLHMINMDRSVILAATSAGKSLIVYCAMRIFQLMDHLEDKTLFLTVPSTLLVEQMHTDFKNYSTFPESTWHVDQHCQKISGQYTKFINSQIVITTWQSMCRLPTDLIEQSGVIIVDETHTCKADVLVGILEGATNCSIRHGLTGTLDGVECNELVIQGLLGPKKRVVSARDLIDAGRASDIKITMLMLQHNNNTVNNYLTVINNVPHKRRYNAEVEFLNAHEERNQMILDLVSTLSGNTLVLFDRVEEYGKVLYERYKEDHPDNTFIITGDVSTSNREEIRTSMEDHDQAVIWASFGTMSTGVSIKKIHNLVIISSSKSKIRILQSIGRLMRLHASKDQANIIDIVDNLSYKSKSNYSLEHSKTRLDYYSNEKFKIKFDQINL